jgi:GT2 family glycosyltransferase
VQRVSVVVVSYNTRELLRRCLAALSGVHQAIVVDNGSEDGSADMVAQEFPSVALIRNSGNLGFGRANNQGLEVATGELALLLNSDAATAPGAVATLAAAFADPEVVAAGGRLVYPNGETQNSTAGRLTLWALFCEQTGLEKLAPGLRLLSPYWNTVRLAARGDGSHEVVQVMGACLMMRRVAGEFMRFDERFFLYCEDTELCHRLSTHGRIVYVPCAVFRHELGASSSGARWLAVARYNRGKELYFRIHLGPAHSVVAWLMNRAGALLRLAAWSLLAAVTLGTSRRARDRASLFVRVLLAPVAGPDEPSRTPCPVP